MALSSEQASIITFLLVNRLEENGVQPLTTGEFWNLAHSIDDLSILSGKPSAKISELTGAPDEIAARVEALLARGREAALTRERLEQSGIKAMTPFDDSYPIRLQEQLRDAAPPLLYYAGDSSILAGRSLAIVGSRDIDQQELNVAHEAAHSAVTRGIGVISGAARGIDRVAMATAFANDGVVTGVLADSLVRMLRDPDTRRGVLEGHAIFVTHQNPTTGFNVGAAMARNKVVYALADVTFVVTAASRTGGTWTGADEALRRNYGRVAVWMGEGRGPGNEPLVKAGADPISDVDELFSLETRPAKVDKEDADQLRMRL